MLSGSGDLQLTFSGPAGQTYNVLASDNLTLPESQWTIIGGGTSGNTNVIFTDSAATNPAEFYVIESPQVPGLVNLVSFLLKSSAPWNFRTGVNLLLLQKAAGRFA
jgi:hypothetical protein